jgi:processing peptidase subunit alpha
MSMKMTRLKNGIRIASLPNSNHFLSCGVFIDSGSRMENNQTAGASHVMEKLAFKV